MWIDSKYIDDINDCLENIINGEFEFDKNILARYNTSKYIKTISLLEKLSKRLNSLVEDSNMMNKSAQDGKLDMRIETTKYRGDFAKITNGINSTIDFTVGALRDIGANLDRLSNGDFQAQVSTEYVGDYNTLKTSTNKLGKYLNSLIEDSNMMNKSANDGKLDVRINTTKYKGDFVKITNGINDAMNASASIAWIKDGLNTLSKKLNGDLSINDICVKSVESICTYLGAGVGAMYLYKDDIEALELYGSYAYVERSETKSKFLLGEGVVGQVAMQKSPILLKNIQRDSIIIQTGTTSEPPINTYTYPIIYKDKLYGVIEIGLSTILTKSALEFFDEANDMIATAVYAGLQNKVVKDLLDNATQSNLLLQEQSEELQQINIKLEEQQQLLEEANAQMEEQQQMLETSKVELENKNIFLENSRQELLKKAQELEQSNRYKSEFLANMSHELRTPLNSIILLSEIMKRNKNNNLDAEDVKKASIIYQSGHELLKLISDILDLSKVEAGKVDVKMDNFTTKNLINDLKDLFDDIAKSKGLVFDIEDNINGVILSDKDKISQIVRNLLSNAFKFTKEGKVTLKLYQENQNYIAISVKDTGIGIPNEKQSQIFEAFRQADGSINREYGGTGLGLSISREFARVLNGNIEIISSENKGSEFILHIPNHIIVDNKAKKGDDRESLGIKEGAYLIVDSDFDFAIQIKDKINLLSRKVLIAKTQYEALDMIQHYVISGVFLDIDDINGMDILRELKSDTVLRKIPIFLLSASSRNTKFLQMGAIGYIQKPISDEVLTNTIESIIAYDNKKVKNLLIIEQDKKLAQDMKDLIGNGTVKSYLVHTKIDAIEEIKKGSYDLVVIDFCLDSGDGIDICEYINKNYQNLPIIVYTAREMTKEDDDKIQKYTDSIIIKKANSNERLLSEVDLFLHRPKIDTKLSTQSISNISLKGVNVLIADDDIKNIYVIESVLLEYGAITYHSQNGKDAIDMLNKNKNINVILMDIMMPVMNGYEAIKSIKANEATKHIPIIAITAKAMSDDKQKCIDVGANDYISKPLNAEKLVGMIKTYIK